MIDFEEEIQRFKPSLDVEAVEDAIVKSDLTDMTDIMTGIVKAGGLTVRACLGYLKLVFRG